MDWRWATAVSPADGHAALPLPTKWPASPGAGAASHEGHTLAAQPFHAVSPGAQWPTSLASPHWSFSTESMGSSQHAPAAAAPPGFACQTSSSALPRRRRIYFCTGPCCVPPGLAAPPHMPAWSPSSWSVFRRRPAALARPPSLPLMPHLHRHHPPCGPHFDESGAQSIQPVYYEPEGSNSDNRPYVASAFAARVAAASDGGAPSCGTPAGAAEAVLAPDPQPTDSLTHSAAPCEHALFGGGALQDIWRQWSGEAPTVGDLASVLAWEDIPERLATPPLPLPSVDEPHAPQLVGSASAPHLRAPADTSSEQPAGARASCGGSAAIAAPPGNTPAAAGGGAPVPVWAEVSVDAPWGDDVFAGGPTPVGWTRVGSAPSGMAAVGRHGSDNGSTAACTPIEDEAPPAAKRLRTAASSEYAAACSYTDGPFATHSALHLGVPVAMRTSGCGAGYTPARPPGARVPSCCNSGRGGHLAAWVPSPVPWPPATASLPPLPRMPPLCGRLLHMAPYLPAARVPVRAQSEQHAAALASASSSSSATWDAPPCGVLPPGWPGSSAAGAAGEY